MEPIQPWFSGLVSRPFTAERWLSICSLSAWVAVISGAVLLGLAFPTGAMLYLTYIAFALASIVSLHSGFFYYATFLKSEGKSLSKRVPKYIEYAYALLISVALLQVFVSMPQFASFIDYVAGDERALLDAIDLQVKVHLRDCKKIDARFFTRGYCDKIDKIAGITGGEQRKEFIVTHISADSEFMNHVVSEVVAINPHTGDALANEFESPLRNLVDRLTAKERAKAFELEAPGKKFFTWIAFLLLPIGIGLRLVKTSLELFVDMT